MDTFRKLLAEIRSWEGRIHSWLNLRYPIQLRATEAMLVWLVDGILRDPVFGVLAALVLVVVAVVGTHTIVVLATGALWLISTLWIARSRTLGKLSILTRSFSVFLSSLILGAISYSFGAWALGQNAEQHAGRLNITRYEAFQVKEGEKVMLNVYWENTGETDVSFQGVGSFAIVEQPQNFTKAKLLELEDAMLSQAKKNKPTGMVLDTVAHGHSWTTLTGAFVPPNDVRKIDGGDAVVMAVGILRYVSAPARPDLSYCIVWGKDYRVVMDCSEINRLASSGG